MCWHFHFSGAPQTFTVPATAEYLVTAIGANGAAGANGDPGGRGAEMGGVFALTAGDSLLIYVGRAGLAMGEGGEASYVALRAGGALVPLVVAGAGGGGGLGLAGEDGSPRAFEPGAGFFPEAGGQAGGSAPGQGGRSYLAGSALPSAHTVQLRGANTADAQGHGQVRILPMGAVGKYADF